LEKIARMCFSTALSVTKRRLGDTGVRPPLGHQPEHLTLPRREHVERASASDELAHDLRVERGPALDDALHGVEEVSHVPDPLLEEVADRTAAVGEQLGRVRVLDVLGKDEHREPRLPAPRLDRRPQPPVPELGRKTDVTTATSGFSITIARRRSDPLSTAATTSWPPSSSRRTIPSRSSARSSAITTRTGSPHGRSSGRPRCS
jgi:hypothetical protein